MSQILDIRLLQKGNSMDVFTTSRRVDPLVISLLRYGGRILLSIEQSHEGSPH